ncbi:TPA: hypothetical protein VDU83_002525 [Pseudomonas aeruginosa]|nr:hypothetical protein [Pseudomonas aeruginosa]
MSFIPSCDNGADALNSLATIYGVAEDAIQEILQHPDVLEIANISDQMSSEWFPAVIIQLLRSSPNYDLTHAAYYHTTSYDGSLEWFDEGLHGSLEGAQRFLEKISHWVPEELRDAVHQTTSALIARRSEYEGTRGALAGPYAWNTLTAASAAENGGKYQVPEVIRDLWSQSGIGNGGLIDLSERIRQHLKPVVVKFKGKTSDLDRYCSTLWAYLLTQDEPVHLTHTFQANGERIPRGDILALIDL